MEMLCDDQYDYQYLERLILNLSEFETQGAPSPTYEMTARGSTVRVSRKMKQVLDVFRIEFPDPKNSKWSPTICMVPMELKEGNGCYDPVAVRIGLPLRVARNAAIEAKFVEGTETELHVRKTELVRKLLPTQYQDLERYKSFCVVQLIISRPRPDNDPAELMTVLFESMKARLGDIEKCYSYPNVCSPFLEALRTMLIDGCFILHRLLKYAHLADRVAGAAKKPGGQGSSEVDDDYGDDDWTQTRGRCFVWQLVTRDLLLLQNQIPFFVLRDLFDNLKKDGESDDTLVKGSLMLFRALCPQMLPDSVPDSVSNIANKPYGVHHLLHLFYLLVGGKELKHSAGPGNNNDDAKEEEEKEPRGLTDVLPSELPQWIPGAKELLEAGIRLRKRKNATSFLDIKFDFCSGVLEIPPLQLYDYSEPVFRNMIAFEQTYPHTEFHVSTYSVFMNCLVSTAEDARILHLRGILVNMMNGGDQDGGRHFFDRICSHVHFPSKNYLVDTMAGVNKYIQSRHHRWRAALVRDYFSNPWVAISVVAAVFLLCLTVLQTVFTVYPYFKPSK